MSLFVGLPLIAAGVGGYAIYRSWNDPPPKVIEKTMSREEALADLGQHRAKHAQAEEFASVQSGAGELQASLLARGADLEEVKRLVEQLDALAGRAASDLATRRELDVVMLSVKGEVRDKLQGLQEGAVDYITNPFVIDLFLSRIERVLESRPTGPSAPPRDLSP